MFAPVLFASATAQGQSPDGLSTLILLISSSGITAVVVSIITAIVNRRKLSAEATNIISQAAGGVVERLEAENKRLNQELIAFRKRIVDLELIEDKRKDSADLLEQQIRLHQQYDRMLLAKLAEQGVTVDPPPPLIVPR